jgi:hypothetical protein
MFYSEQMDACLYLGDVIKGYILTPTTILKPDWTITQLKNTSMTELPVFSVVLTSCRLIEDGLLCLTSLIPLDNSFCKSQYYASDFTVINHVIQPKLGFPTGDEGEFKLEQKEATTKINYPLLNHFVYEQNDLFPKYILGNLETRYYEIDFSNITTIKYSSIEHAKQESELLKSKCLQLSDSTREELNQKLSCYYKDKNHKN